MYEAKRAGRNRYAFYESSMNEATTRRHDIETRLRRCLENEELQLAYQPIRNAISSEICGAEALLRVPGELADIGIAELIGVAEMSGVIHELGRWVLRRACRDLQIWREQGLAVPPLAINASVQQLQQAEFAQETLETILESGSSPGELEIEVTEAAILANDRQIEATLLLLAEAGIHLVLDDFGTSHASIRHLHRFAFDRIKIDRSFISEMTTSREYAHLTAAIIGMARGLGVAVVAEGVETEEQAATLLDYGCDQLQGHLIGREMTADGFATWLAEAKTQSDAR
jgi:EAL domain-containing protein (putative c-di-GMP-specific phosphodiesterase class I)